MHERLLRAYFSESRDITDRETLRSLWAEVGLPEDEFVRIDDPALLREVLAQHREAQEAGVTGVPAVQLAGNDAVIVGAHPLDLYRRWVERTRARRGAPTSS
jgi:predicted DsbA family dithiol-disulfide isomerase